MGLDLIVSEQTDFRKNEKGQYCHTVTELFNFRPNGHTVMSYVADLDGMDNCSSKTVDAVDFLDALQDMKNDLEEIEQKGERFNNQRVELKNTIQDLECFLEENNISETIEAGERTFEVYLSY